MNNKTQILNRINQLRDAIAYSRNELKIMNIGEGIYCNCEIAAWFRVLDEENLEPHYTISEATNEKVKQITEIINTTGWKRPKIYAI